MKKILYLFAGLFAAAPAGYAQFSLEGLKEGAVNAAKAVGEGAGRAVEATGKAVGSVGETMDSTKKSLQDESSPAATRAKLDAMAAHTLKRLFAEQPDSVALFEQSAGYAVFDAREASFYVVAGYGRGVAVNRQTEIPVYMKMATAGAGISLGLGGFESQILILFEHHEEFSRFVTQGLDATAAVDTMTGDTKDQLALRFHEGKAVFVLTKKGWKISAKLTGSRYWPDKELNASGS